MNVLRFYDGSALTDAEIASAKVRCIPVQRRTIGAHTLISAHTSGYIYFYWKCHRCIFLPATMCVHFHAGLILPSLSANVVTCVLVYIRAARSSLRQCRHQHQSYR